MEQFTVRSSKREIVMDITSDVKKIVENSSISSGICIVYIPHTTAGVTINENADPSVKVDIKETLEKLIPAGDHYRHLEGNADSHLKASIMGSSATIIIENGQLQLGTWQGIQFCEFDGPRNRTVWVTLLDRNC